MKRVAALLATALLVTACAGTGEKKPMVDATAENASQAIAAAEMTTKEASSSGFEWRDTGKMIESAKKAAEKKDYAMAISIANKAKRQSENALEQAKMAN